MTSSQTDPRPPGDRLAVAARALAVVLDLEADELRADSPLADLGADAIARVQWADLVETTSAELGDPVVVDDADLDRAATLGDLAASLRPAVPA